MPDFLFFFFRFSLLQPLKSEKFTCKKKKNLRISSYVLKHLSQVVVKDFLSRAVVAQFRAHTSPISALCFDPSGTLLVTASIHGNNINIFRIMPSCSRNGSFSQPLDWGSSFVHLYKLHRGMTSAVCSYPLLLKLLCFICS